MSSYAKKQAKRNEKHLSPGYPAQAQSQYPPMVLQEFIITNGISDRNLKVFPSEKSMQMYKEYKKLSRHDPAFERAKQNQNLTYALPLAISKRSLSIGLGDTTYLRFLECLPSPEAPDRLYDRVDNRHIGEVLRRKFLGYMRYRLQIKGVEIVIIAHLRLPILDFQIQNERFRFVKTVVPTFNPHRFHYELYLLSPDQPSLVDNMDSSLKVQSDNPLLGSHLLNIFPFKWHPSDRSKYTSPHKWGSYDYFSSWELFTRTRKCSTFSMYTNAVGVEDANSAVEFRTLIIVTITFILQSIEDDLQALRRTNKNLQRM